MLQMVDAGSSNPNDAACYQEWSYSNGIGAATTRMGYFGFASTNTVDITLKNEVAGGDIVLNPNDKIRSIKLHDMESGLSFDSGVNVLDEYEEGIWTPTIFGSTITGSPIYTVQGGSYTRIGNLVHVSCQIIWTSLGGATGQMRAGGLPFNIKSGNINRAAISISWYNSLAMASGVTVLGGFGTPNTNYIKLWAADTPRNDSNHLLNETELTETGELYFSMTYNVT